MLPDIGHVVEILIDSRLTQGVPEQRLQGPGAAGRHNHPIKPFFRNRIGNLLDGIGGARKQLFLGKDHIGQGQRIFNRRGNIHHPADIGAAVAHKHTDARLLFGDIPFRRINLGGGQLAPPVVQALTTLGPGGAGRENRLGDIHGSLEGTADKNPRSAGQHGIGRIRFAETVFVERNTERVRQIRTIGRGIQSDRQNHHVEGFLFDAVVFSCVFDDDILGFRVLADDRCVASDESCPGKLFGSLEERFEIPCHRSGYRCGISCTRYRCHDLWSKSPVSGCRCSRLPSSSCCHPR
jgi:hypothetical protein